MPILLKLLAGKLRKPGSWLLPISIAIFVFVTGWLLMAVADPDNAIVQPDIYWWWFLITASTVGYGDFFPTGVAGHPARTS